ncbi:MAG: hypothetical protein IKC19_06500 [Bacteroidales bacterium]|nr:hypothetical protein [Bacteroidales bacterium]
MERFINLTNRCLAVFLDVEFYSRNQGWNETNWRNAEKYRDLCQGGANLRIFLGLILSCPVAVALIKFFGNNVWTTLSSFVLSIGLSFLFHWYFVTYKCKWRKYWDEYERQTKHQHRIWMAITIVTVCLYVAACIFGAIMISKYVPSL